jgi:integrase
VRRRRPLNSVVRPTGRGKLRLRLVNATVPILRGNQGHSEPGNEGSGACERRWQTKYGLHSLRHFFASWLINRKEDGGREMPLKTAQMLLGHSSITMTADVYGHLFPRGDDAGELADAERGIMG